MAKTSSHPNVKDVMRQEYRALDVGGQTHYGVKTPPQRASVN